MTTKRYLVTGGAGFIGSALVRALVGAGQQVRVLDDESRGSARRLADVAAATEMIAGDVRDPAAVRAAVRGTDAVCHLAAVNGTEFFYGRPELVLEVAVKGMLNVLDACVAEGVGELALTSSSEVYQTPPVVPTDETAPLSIPDPFNPRYSYAAGKMISELLAINYGRRRLRRVVIVRPHNVYGPDMGWEHVIPQLALRVQEIVRGSPAGPVRLPIQGTGRETRAFVHLDDFIGGFRLVLEHGEHLGLYHIGTMHEVQIAEVARLVGAAFGREVEVVPGPPAAGSPPRRCPDTAKVAALGFRPAVPLRDGIAATVRWYREHAREAPPAVGPAAGA